jgi:ubiquinone biosynthesis protein
MKKYLKYHEGIQIHVVTQIQRFSQIVEILGKYGFGIVLEKVFPDHSRGGYPINGGSPEPPAMYERMRLAIEELGPAFVKFGQILSTRADLLPPEMIGELKKLQDRVKPVPFLEVRPVIEECCPHPDDLFREIDETPVASASVAQVHRAILKRRDTGCPQDTASRYQGRHRDRSPYSADNGGTG